ncbi:MAG TPA: S8 family peptidase, partial [Vicinamibacterales bacterium]|nr:S8 family peptidase [Vicinamibacterales bacterium]
MTHKQTVKRKAVWGPKRTGGALLLLLVSLASQALASGQHAKTAATKHPGVPSQAVKAYKADDEVSRRAADINPRHTTPVIVELVSGTQLPAEFRKYSKNRPLGILNGEVLELPNNMLARLAAHPNVYRLHYDRPVQTHNYRTSVTVGARTVQDLLGYTGSGIGIAVIDSGITTWHDDLTNRSSKTYPYSNQRVSKFVDFVNGRTLPYDDNGHGSHVAGIIAGNGYDSRGEKAGIAPGASLVSLKVLDANGQGSISHIIAALDWVVANYRTYNIRVVNMSVGAGIHESYWTDPLTLAAKRVTDLGITVVAAAGNMGKNAAGQLQWGAITAPGNAPWVLTVGASSTMGTLTRSDDQMADYSSSGPTFIDFEAKPDLVAPGTGTVSLAVPGSTFYVTKAASLLAGTVGLGSKPYLALSGTSMAAPVVSGSVALMLQANPNLTPNLIKAILQYTAQPYPGYSPLRQGAGFVNTLGAVRLAGYYATARSGDRMPVQTIWSKQIIWGSHRLSGGYINPATNAWATNVVWGTAQTLETSGDNIVWGTTCSDCDNVVWGTALDG